MFSVGKKGFDFDGPEMMNLYMHMLFAFFRILKQSFSQAKKSLHAFSEK